MCHTFVCQNTTDTVTSWRQILVTLTDVNIYRRKAKENINILFYRLLYHTPNFCFTRCDGSLLGLSTSRPTAPMGPGQLIWTIKVKCLRPSGNVHIGIRVLYIIDWLCLSPGKDTCQMVETRAIIHEKKSNKLESTPPEVYHKSLPLVELQTKCAMLFWETTGLATQHPGG